MGRYLAVVLLAGCAFERAGGGAGTGPETDWWDPSYRFRAPITVTAAQAIDAAYAVQLATDTAALVAAGHLASPDDWRIVRHTGDHAWEELPRWIDDGEGAWSSIDTRTWFRSVALAAGSSDATTYVYYGAEAPAAAPGKIGDVFLFADDFENGLAQWAANNRGEQVTTDAAQPRAGRRALAFDTNGTECAGLHRDLELPATQVMFTQYIRQAQTTASFGVARTFEVPYAMRAPSWVDARGRLGTELDSNNRMQVWAQNNVLENWFVDFGVDTWHRIDTAFDPASDVVRVRADGGAWFGPYDGFYRQTTAQRSIAVEGEGGQAGRFSLDNFIIRPFVDPEPAVTLGPEEALTSPGS